MPGLKLAKLPDRTPVKMSIQLLPDLVQALRDYAAAYGVSEPVENLIPYMLSSFFESARAFSRFLKK